MRLFEVLRDNARLIKLRLISGNRKGDDKLLFY